MTCAITNDDEPVELIIEKTVINDDGGTATVDDFGITTDAAARSPSRSDGRRRPRRLHRRDAPGPSGHLHARRARRGRLHADRLAVHENADRTLRRGSVTRRGPATPP